MIVGQADTIDTFEKFHKYVFGKDPKDSGVMWNQLKQNPVDALHSILALCSNPQLHTLETGFLMGAVLGYALQTDPLKVIPLIEGMKFQMKVRENAGH